jgi:protein-tyrosine-phosphatase
MIRGTLTEFSLPELIRLVSETHKTGVLEIAGPHGAGELLFLDGCVCGSRSDSSREPLGRKLVRAKAISQRDLWSALDDQSRRHQRLGQLLIARGSVSSEQVQSALREQIEDGAVDIVTLGPTHFEWRSEPPDEPSPVLIPPESFLSGVAERVEEMEKIRERIPAQDAVVSICPTPSEETLESGVSREEWRILAMLGSKRTVGDLMRYSGSGDIRTLRALDRLMSAGLLELGEASRRPPRPPPSGGPPKDSGPVVEQGDRTIRLPHGPTRTVFRSGPAAAGGGEPFRLAIVATSNRPHSLLGAAVLRTLTGDLPVRVVLHRLDDLGPVAPSAEALLRAEELGVDLASFPARQLRRGELAEADLIVGLDWWHVDRAVSYGGGAPSKSFTIAELLKLLESEEVAVRETRLVTKARLLVEHAHELRLAASIRERHPATSGHDSRFSDAQSLDCWSQLARLLFSVEAVEEIS